MGKNLYVGNLSYTTNDQGLNEFFAQAGKVASAQVITDRQTGRSRGFAFVEMETDEDAKKAIDTLNGKELDGRPLRVNEAKPKTERE